MCVCVCVCAQFIQVWMVTEKIILLFLPQNKRYINDRFEITQPPTCAQELKSKRVLAL